MLDATDGLAAIVISYVLTNSFVKLKLHFGVQLTPGMTPLPS
jgi:hypothetical protein